MGQKRPKRAIELLFAAGILETLPPAIIWIGVGFQQAPFLMSALTLPSILILVSALLMHFNAKRLKLWAALGLAFSVVSIFSVGLLIFALFIAMTSGVFAFLGLATSYLAGFILGIIGGILGLIYKA